MVIRCIKIALLALLVSGCAGKIGAFQQTVVIKNDRGGLIGNFTAKYKRWDAANKKVVIDGYCASSCTIFIGTIKPQNVCLTKNAILGFHGAWGLSWGGKEELKDQTHLMTDYYTLPINAWIATRGGLGTYKKMILMSYPETALYFRMCQ